MDWKKEAADKLKIYESKKGSMLRAGQEIQRLEQELCNIRAVRTDGSPVSGGTSRREDMIINNIALRQELRSAIEDTEKWLRIVDGALATLSPEERLILDRMYIHRHKGNVERVCDELKIEKTAVYRRRDAALRKFTISMYGSE